MKTRYSVSNVNHGSFKVVRTANGKANLSVSYTYSSTCIKFYNLASSVAKSYPLYGVRRYIHYIWFQFLLYNTVLSPTIICTKVRSISNPNFINVM
jgi:hypothetical protein